MVSASASLCAAERTQPAGGRLRARSECSAASFPRPLTSFRCFFARPFESALSDAYKEGNYDEAIALYSEAIELCPRAHRAPFLGNRSAAWLMKKEFAKCLADCEAARELDPTFAKVYARAFKVYMQTGEFDKARAMLDAQAAKTSTPPTAKEIAQCDQAQLRWKQLQNTIKNQSWSSVQYQVGVLLRDTCPDSIACKIIEVDAALNLKQFEKGEANKHACEAHMHSVTPQSRTRL